MSIRLAIRLALGWLLLSALQLGVWALLAPQSFYDNFPGFGRTWVAVDGPFNEHFVRDFGALNLALAVVLIFAIIRLSRDLVLVAAIASLVWGVPHVIYHIINTDGLDGVDIAGNVIGLGASVVVALGLVAASRHLGPDRTAPDRMDTVESAGL